METEKGPNSDHHKKKSDSDRLVLGDLYEMGDGHTLADFFEKAPDLIKSNPYVSAYQTAGALLNDSRSIRVSYPFTDHKIKVEIKTYFKMLVIGLAKKGRFPDEVTKDESGKEMSTNVFSLLKAVNLLIGQSDDELRSSSGSIDKKKLEETIRTTTNVYLIRVNNLIGLEKLPEEVRKRYIRPKLTDQQRETLIVADPESTIMLHLYHYAVTERNVSDIEKIYLYLLLIDPQMNEFALSFEYESAVMNEKLRFLLYEAVRYAIEISFYGSGDLENTEWRESCIKLQTSILKEVFEVLIGKACSPNEEEDQENVHPGLIEKIDTNFQSLLGDDDPDFSRLASLREGDPKGPSEIPSAVIRELKDRASRAGKTNNFLFIGLMNFLLKNVNSSSKFSLERKLYPSDPDSTETL